ncbi:MAG: bifunctional metallophosphatase/5'-nucleotidase [Ruminococcaceae bacterium]|nr:bifunctional metallophosphatase/5'-nucleotidase [Oscillospiraceae bacterium]
MKKLIRHFCVTAVAIAMFLSLSVFASAENKTDVTILFTHDLHSHFLPVTDENGNSFGGYARLMTVINQQKEKHPDAVLVDGGDFAMGSLFQTAYTTNALELRMMGAMGYDATTFGNHEFDYLPQGLMAMLDAAVSSGEYVPAIVDANYLPDIKSDLCDPAAYQKALDNYGVKDYIILERGGIYYAIFGILGFDSNDCAPNSGMVLADPVTTAQKTVDMAVADCLAVYGKEPVVICLSHSGTSGDEGEDYELAKAVNGIDVIISGHTHTTSPEPIVVNNTVIASAGEYGRYLGVVNLSFSADGTSELTGYELIPVDDSVAEDAEIAALVENYKTEVEENYLSKYGMTFDQVLVSNSYKFDTVKEVYATQHESTLCNIFSDAYKWAAEEALGKTVDMAVTAAGVIRESLPVGDVTVSDVFNAASLGVGTEGELVSVYLTGAELKSVLEIDATVQPLMSNAQLFPSGVEYSYNKNRMLFNKVDYAMLRRDDGSLKEIDDDKLYNVVTGMYCGEMLGSVEKTSFGLISIVPKDKDGNAIDMSRLADYVIRDKNGNPVKEWYAISSYLENMGGEMDSRYSQPDGRKVVYSSLNPVKLLSKANKFTYILIAVIVAFALIVVSIVHLIVKAKKRKSKQNKSK